ncbi:PREDICTED: uncharacterized protein LOC109208487 [Nicotiana attenuata]|uniref:uncharacterized protein LOC109208487 n=1 Tax=Nicotiana attenuata TaxID=49451 RepID=UPI000905797C|nr:PREDICTED: uncharacterized protein LOC109208487 [Nicotiana attenuata]
MAKQENLSWFDIIPVLRTTSGEREYGLVEEVRNAGGIHSKLKSSFNFFTYSTPLQQDILVRVKMIKRFFNPQTSSGSTSSSPSLSSPSCPVVNNNVNSSQSSHLHNMLDLNPLERDPGERKQISEYPPNLRDRVRRHYIEKGPCQLREFDFPNTNFGGKLRHFNPEWFKTSYSEWLEYSIKKDAAFCLCCYLFKNEIGGYGKKVGDSFTIDDFRAWNKGIERLNAHVGQVSSVHNRCLR